MSKEFTLFSFAIRNLKRKPLRTGILIVAIGLLVSSIVFALSFVRRVDTSIKVTADRLGADIIVVPRGSRGAAEDILLENRVKSFYMDRNVIEKVKQINGIDKVTYQTYLVTLAGQCCDVPETLIVAFNQDTDFIVKPWLTQKLGRRLQKGEAIVGSESAFNISVGLTEVDGVLFGNVFKMVGVLDKTGSGLDTALFVDEANIDNILKHGKTNLQPGQISIIFAKVKEGFDPYKVAGDITDNILEVNPVARKDIGKSLVNALKDINRIFFITVMIASLLAAFLAWAVFSAIANERAREVGIMRAIGAKESHIVKLFVFEVILIGITGSLLGIVSGTALSLLLAKSFTILQKISFDLSITERMFIVFFGLLVGTGICVVGALSPIRKIKSLEPLVVIKGE